LKEKVKHENDLKIDAIKLLRRYKYSFILCSSTDIDRLASFHEASKKSGRSFLCDSYQKEILDIFTTNAISELFKFDNAYFYKHHHEKQFVAIREKGFCMLVRSSQIKIIKDLLESGYLPAEDTLLIYSMWDGYINENVKEGENIIQDYLNIWNLFKNKEKIHTSGHASPETLAKVCELVNPKTAIIPIHSEHSEELVNIVADKQKEKIITASGEKDNITIKIF